MKNNMEKIDKAIEILQAFKEGKTLQNKVYSYTGKHTSDILWEDSKFTEESLINVLHTSVLGCIRIKPDAIYRPYANAEEFIKASKEHGPYIKDKDIYYLPDEVTNVGLRPFGDYRRMNWIEVFNYCKWQDGTPCGVLEE